MEFLRRTQSHLAGRVAAVAAAVAFSGLASLALLPLATRVLHAGDYGTYAVLMSIVALVGTAMDGGATLLLPEAYGPASTAERKRVITSIAGLAGLGAAASGLALTGLWVWQHSAFTDQPLPVFVIAITAVLMPLRALTNISIITFMATGRSIAIAAQMAGQAVAVFAGTVIALFGFGLGGASLFVGALSGQLTALGICLLVLGYHRELGLPSSYWIRRAAAKFSTSATLAFVDGARCFYENIALTSISGLHAVGLLSHARLYNGLINGFGNSVAQSVWSKSLEEARDPGTRFEATRRAWAPMQTAFGCAGLIFVFFGRDVVELISNGKLTDAANFIPALLICALLQLTSQPAAAIVFAAGSAASAAWFRTAILLGNMLLLYPTVMLFGVPGLLALGIIEMATFRVYLHILAARTRRVPFQDHIAVFGCLTIAATAAFVHFAGPSFDIRLAMLLASVAMLAIAGQHAEILMPSKLWESAARPIERLIVRSPLFRHRGAQPGAFGR